MIRIFISLNYISDNLASKECVCLGINLPCLRLIYAPTGPLDRDIDDVRRFSDASFNGVER